MKKLADHLGQELAQQAQTDPRIFVLDGDLADSDGAYLFAQQHPDRFLMAGIAEQNMVSVAAGMADCGVRPWVFSFAAFLSYRAYDQVRIGLSQAEQPVTLVGSHAGGLAARNGKTHAAPNDLALMLSLPNMHVWAPGDFSDVQLAVASSLQNNAPCYIRLPRRAFSAHEQLKVEEGLGQTSPRPASGERWLREKQSVTIVSTGLGSHWALEAADILLQQGYLVGLLHCPCLAPLPPLAQELAGVSQIVVIEDHTVFGGLASLLASLGLTAPITSFGWPMQYCGKSGSDEQLRAHYGLSGTALAAKIAPLTQTSAPVALAQGAHSLHSIVSCIS